MRLKKVFAGALAAAMLVCAVAVPAFAAEEVEQENCLTSSYVQMMGDVDIDPETKSGDGASWYPIQKVFNFGLNLTF